MVSKRFDLSVEDTICLEKAWGWGLLALAMESGCQLASSDNCFPWQDPVGPGEEERSVESQRGNPFSLQPSHNCFHEHEDTPCQSAWGPSSDWHPLTRESGRWWEWGRGAWKALSINPIVTQRYEVEERGGDGKVKGKKQRKEEEEGKKNNQDNHDYMLVHLSCSFYDRFLFHYSFFQNPTFSPVNDHLHKSIKQ